MTNLQILMPGMAVIIAAQVLLVKLFGGDDDGHA